MDGFDVSNDIWYTILSYTFPDTLFNVGKCSKYFHNLTDPHLPPMNRYWKSVAKLLIQQDDNLNVIEIPHDYCLNNWFGFYFECKRLGEHIQSWIQYGRSVRYNHLSNDHDQMLEFLVTLGVPDYPACKTKYDKYEKIYRGCVHCDCSTLCDLLVEIRDIFKEFEETTNYNYEYNLCLIAGESLYDRLITWFVFEAIEFEAVGIIDYLLSLKNFKIDCIDPRYDETPLIYAINCVRSGSRSMKSMDADTDTDTDLRLDKTISIIRKLIKHPKMTPDIINTYTDNNNQTALTLAMNSSCFKDNSNGNSNNKYNIAALLLKHGADINVQTVVKYSTIDSSINSNKRKIVYSRELDGCDCALTEIYDFSTFTMLVDERPEVLFTRDPTTGMTTLMYAVDGGHYDIVEFIVTQLNEMKDKINGKKRNGGMITNDDYQTLDKIKNFVYAGKHSNGYTAYFIACEKGDWKIVKYLIQSLDISVWTYYLKEFSCIGYKFTGSEAAKAAGHDKLARWLLRREKQQRYYDNSIRYYNNYNDKYY